MADSRLGDIRNDNAAEFGQLVLRYLDEAITPEEHELLETRLRTNDADRQMFVELCEQVSFVTETVLPRHVPTHPGAPTKQQGNVPIVTFVGDTLHSGINLLSRPFVLSILFTIGLPGVILLVLMVSLRSQPGPEVAKAPPPVAVAPVAVSVAQMGQMHDCQWEQGSASPSSGDGLTSGQQLRLRRGLAELRFANGATVLLAGPATFDTVSGGAGFLHAGSLTAKVSTKARGFTIQTPTAAVVDLGTEFGVTVENAGAKEEVHVFRGEVVLETKPSRVEAKPARHRLTAGSAASIVLASGQSEPTIHEIAFRADRYIHNLPSAASAPPQPAIVADFSGGEGKSAVDQYPGTAGSGWATGWARQKGGGATCTATIQRDNPLLDGGDHLQVLIERKSGANECRRTVERKLDLTGPVDLTKPYVISFSVRVDAMGLFDGRGDMLIFSNNIASRLKPFKLSRTSGWHIRVAGADDKRAKARHWSFISGDGKGNDQSVDSGVAVAEGATYSFRILVDPQARQWTPSIATGGGEPTTFEAMGMRSAGTAEECRYWPYLCFTGYITGGNKGVETERLGFSVDSIRITAAEENDRN